MIRSMTGYGAAERTNDQVRIAVEIRTINNRFFKANQRLPEGLGAIEMIIENLLRAAISRGTVNLSLTVDPKGSAARAPVNAALLAAYLKDVVDLGQANIPGFRPEGVRVEALLSLPGVVGSEQVLLVGIDGLPAQIEAVVKDAIEHLNAMRDQEGQATARDMAAALDEMDRRIAEILTRVPAVLEEYRARLHERVTALVQGADVPMDDQTLLREVAFFAERSDINEELSRLKSHVEQFRELLAACGPAGRKLEFLTQEMYREVNTIGSKSSDSQISRDVVEIKVCVDRLREQAQNIE
jgi:uncharacterized protein (TIGR00255 family)